MNDEKPIIIDFHLHAKYKGRQIVKEILQEMNQLNVDKAVLLGRDTSANDLDEPEKRNRIVTSLLSIQSARATSLKETLKTIRDELSRSITNEETFAYVQSNPSKFIGVGSINLSKSEEYVITKLTEVNSLGLIGIKFYPQIQFFNPLDNNNLRLVCERLKKRRKILIFHTGVMPGIWESPIVSKDANPKYLEPIIREYEEVPFVLAHFGAYSNTYPGIWFDEALTLGERYDNIWFDISAVPYIVTEKHMIDKARLKVGVDRILYGSDYLDYMGFSLEAVKGTPYLNDREKIKILGLNALELLESLNP